eukprot:UN15612
MNPLNLSKLFFNLCGIEIVGVDVPDPGHSFSVGERVLFEIGDDDFEGTVSKIVSSKMVWVEYVNADGRNEKRLYD